MTDQLEQIIADVTAVLRCQQGHVTDKARERDAVWIAELWALLASGLAIADRLKAIKLFPRADCH